MIQRIQSIFLLAAAICSVISLLVPFAYFESATNEVLLYAFHYTDIEGTPLEGVGTTTPLGILIGVSLFASLLCIFLYKNRKIQMRICLYNIIINIGSLGLIYFYSAYATSEDINMTVKLGSILPVVSAILSFLAFRSIRKDDAVIKSLDRIR